MILSCITFVRAMNCENCQLCYQPVTIENYLLPAHKDHYALRRYEQKINVFNFQHSSPE